MTDARVKFIGTLAIAGMIQPHSGQEKLVLEALDEYERQISATPEPEDTHALEIEDAANNHGLGPVLVVTEEAGSSSAKYGDADFAQNHDPYGIGAEYTGQSFAGLALIPAGATNSALPTAEDLDAAAAEQQAREATATAAASPGTGEADQALQPAPVAESQSQEDEHGD